MARNSDGKFRLVPKPKLIEGQDAWLDSVYDALLCSTQILRCSQDDSLRLEKVYSVLLCSMGTGCQSTNASK